jgi:acetyl-CoA C-acetyltransferase
MQDSMIQDGLWDAFNDYHMGITAENLADRYAIDRERRMPLPPVHSRKRRPPSKRAFYAEIVPVASAGQKPPQSSGR